VGLEALALWQTTLVGMRMNRGSRSLCSSSGEGGASCTTQLGEIVENVAGSSEYHWMAGKLSKNTLAR